MQRPVPADPSYGALYPLIGTTYGGNVQTTFNLPDRRGCVPICQGAGDGLNEYSLGQRGGEVAHTLLSNEMANHAHSFNAADDAVDTTEPGGNVLGMGATRTSYLYGDGANVATFADACSATAGGGQPHNNMQPYLAVTFIICLAELFPLHPSS